MGQFVAARTQKIAGPVEPYVGELVAAKHGLLFALELGKDRAELEVDVRNVCKSIAESDQNRSYGSNILRDFFFFFFGYSSCYSEFRCNFGPRQYNGVADALTNYARESHLETWLLQAPTFLDTLIVRCSR